MALLFPQVMELSIAHVKFQSMHELGALVSSFEHLEDLRVMDAEFNEKVGDVPLSVALSNDVTLRKLDISAEKGGALDALSMTVGLSNVQTLRINYYGLHSCSLNYMESLGPHLRHLSIEIMGNSRESH